MQDNGPSQDLSEVNYNTHRVSTVHQYRFKFHKMSEQYHNSFLDQFFLQILKSIIKFEL